MKIYGLQKTTLLDFPERVACTVFLGGCNFRCPFCHNSALISEKSYPEEIAEDVFFDFLKKRKGVLDGVCVTGGEPLCGKDTEEFLTKIKQAGFAIKLDTNGSYPDRLENIVKSGLADYVAMDIKNSRKNYGKAIGIKNYDTSAVEKSVSFLLQNNIPYEFRTTIVKGIHETFDIYDIASWICGAEKYFLQTYVKSDGVLDKEQDFSPFSPEEAENFKEIVSRTVNTVGIRGI